MENQSASKLKLAAIISVVLHPIFMTCVLSIALMIKFSLPLGTFLLITLPMFPPVGAYYIVTVFILKKADFDFSDLRTRRPILVLGTMGLVLSSLISYQVLPDSPFNPMLIRLVGMGLAVTVISFFWKISLHSLFFSSVVVLLTKYYSPVFLLLFALLPALYWSRIKLKSHHLSQLIAGTLLAMVLFP